MKTRKRFDTDIKKEDGYIDSLWEDARKRKEKSSKSLDYTIVDGKRIYNERPKVVRTQFEEEVFEYAGGGKVSKEYKIVPMIPYGVKGMITPDYKNTQKFVGTEDEAVVKAKELASSNPNIVRVEIKRELKTKTNTVGIVDGQNKNYAKGGKLIGGQKKLDLNKNGKLDAQDFKMLRGEKMAKGGNVSDFDVKKFTAFIVFDDDLRNLYYDKAESQGIDSDWDVYAIQEGKEKPNAEELKIMKDIFNSEIKTDSKLLKIYSTADVDFRKNVEKKNNERRNKMAKGGNIRTSSSGLRRYYVETFPSDDMGTDINPKATFRGLYKALEEHKDVYEYIGVEDSLVRERLFSELADIKGVRYNKIYDMWTNYAKGGKVKRKRWIQDALSGDHKGALRETAKRKGLLKGDENLSKTDLKKLEKMGGKTARRARLAETLREFKK